MGPVGADVGATFDATTSRREGQRVARNVYMKARDPTLLLDRRRGSRRESRDGAGPGGLPEPDDPYVVGVPIHRP